MVTWQVSVLQQCSTNSCRPMTSHCQFERNLVQIHYVPYLDYASLSGNNTPSSAIYWIMSRCSGSLGVTLGEAEFTDADDAVLLAQDPGIWQAELKRFDNAATTMGLHTSWEKTKLQNIGYGPIGAGTV